MIAQNLNKKEREEDRELVFNRIFDAPREMVWKAWTDPKQIVKWWGPHGFTTTTSKMEVKAGGIWRFVMHGPDGRDYENKITYEEVKKPERLVYSHGGDDKDLEPVQFHVTVTLEAQGDKTYLTMRSLFPTVKHRDWVVKEYGADEGAKQTLGRLAEYLGKSTFIIERTFNAPIKAVWKAITDKDQMKQWYFKDLESFKPEIGFQTQVNVHHNNKDYLHIWKVTEVTPGEKITYSWKYSDHPGDSFVTFELSPEGNKTRLKLTHEGLETFLPDNNQDFARENFISGWTYFIGLALKDFLEKPVPYTDEPFVISRTFDVPREVVWKAWTIPELMAKWWGPKGFTVGQYNMDFRPGGIYHYSMLSPDGHAMWGKFTYREIAKPEKLIFINCFSDEKGDISRHPMNPTWPLQILSTISFTEEQKGKTTVTIHWSPINASNEECKTFINGMASMNQGWGGTLDQLEIFLTET